MTSAPPTLTPAAEQAQSLATGAVGAALVHHERAVAGTGTWHTAHHHIRATATGPVDIGPHTGLYYGAPAIAFLLHTAGRHEPRYRSAARRLDPHLEQLTHRRVAAATARLRRGIAPTFAEYDLFYGLTGLGALLLRHLPGSDTLGAVLRYLVRLTHPHHQDGVRLPGWWVDHDPDPTLPTPGGHANLGLAHGAAGLLALLSLATSRGHSVNGQRAAIDRLCDWFDTWQQDAPTGPWWPPWIDRHQLRTGDPGPLPPGRPSWCYGAVGIARAQQLAALATGDTARRRTAEHALAACLTDPQLTRLTDPGLCHGAAGLYLTASRAAQDTTTVDLTQHLPRAAARLTTLAAHPGRGHGLLTGEPGITLARETLRHGRPPASEWDSCLLIT